jgi:hypothetical protein
MNKIYLYISLFILIFLGFFLINQKLNLNKKGDEIILNDYKNTKYIIDGNEIQLKDGYAESTIPQSTSKIITRYFGNEFITDLNNDGLDDVVFILTQETGGSGTFYYAVGAINTYKGYVGSDGYYLGDRIAPQSIENSPNPRHKNVVVINYAERKNGEPMTTQPSEMKSVYLKIGQDKIWGIVIPDFEGESR